MQLPPTRQAEVVDFVDFLRSRETDRELTHSASQTAASSFAAVWDNDSDAAYDGDQSTQHLAALTLIPHPGTINGNADDLASLSWKQEGNPRCESAR